MSENSNRDTDNEPVIQTVAEPLQQYLQKASPPSDSVPANRQAAAIPGASNQAKAPASPTSRAPTAAAASPNDRGTIPFRPVNRQPLAMLTIVDDGSREEGELIRIRDSKFTIGREKGDVTIPYDTDMSGTHVQLRCQKQKGRFRWFIIDQESTNGTFVRGFRASLSRETELIFGTRRYQFLMPSAGANATDTQALQTQAYRAPKGTMLDQFVPRLTEVGLDESSARSFSLGSKENFLGSGPPCQIVIDNDPFVSQKHARFYTDESGRWMIEDQKSLNGVWIRVRKFAMDRPTEFQLGQQRFRFVPQID